MRTNFLTATYCILLGLLFIHPDSAFPDIDPPRLQADVAAGPPVSGTPQRSEYFDLSDAINKTIQLQPSILIQKESVNQSAGVLRSAAGDFDWRLESYYNYAKDYSPVPSSNYYKNSDTAVAGFKLGKLFRTGIYLEPNLQYSHSEAEIKEKYNQPDPPVQKTGRVSFLLRVPLLQGLGASSTAAREISAAHELDAARYNLLFKIAQAVQDTALSYWNYRAANDRLAVFKESEARARAILEKTELLVKADEVAAAEIQNVTANLADKESSRISAELALIEARTRLGQAIGIPYEQIPGIPPAAGLLPALSLKQIESRLADSAAYCATAMRERQDIMALKKQLEAVDAQVVAARDQVKPVLNLELSAGADGSKTGSGFQRTTQTFEYRQSTPDWSTGARLVYPFGNNTALGNLQQALSRYNQGQIQLMETERVIQSNVLFTLSSLVNSAQEIEKADEAVRTYEIAVGNERDKYLMGESTILDLLYIQDRQDAARLNRISTLQRAATNLTRLLFETGRLVSFENGVGSVNVEDLVTVLVP